MSGFDLDYDLPQDRIAQFPSPEREAARLLVVDRTHGTLHDATIAELPAWLAPGDILALNETRVRPARLEVRRQPGGGRVELLFVRPAADGRAWHVLARPARGARTGTRLVHSESGLDLVVVEAGEGGERGERSVQVVAGDLALTLRTAGRLPLPPYIVREPTALDEERYQTVYARVEGAIAAPTAGLHLTPRLLDELERRGTTAARLLLHVGPGTFRPMRTDDPRDHAMDPEWFDLPEAAAAALRSARATGGRIVAVGTTTTRVLESACDLNEGRIAATSGWTRKFIHPPYRFQAVDALLTNFHLPRTTLLLLVAALTGEDLLRRAYRHAIDRGYRFYSYGDAMLVV